MKIKLLVVDDNKNLIELIKKYFEDNERVEVVKEAYDGEEATQILKDEIDTFDIMLLDLIMPRKDGIYVLNYMQEHKIKKNTIVISSYNQDDMIRDVSELGVKYYALKPFDFKDLENKILKINESSKQPKKIIDLDSKDINIRISNLLHALGIPSNIKGYQFIRSAIDMVYRNPKLVGGITKELYPDLSVEFNTSIQRVERAIRHAIEVSWLRGDIDLMDEIFGHSVDIDRAKPTNSEFIVTLADKLRLEKME